MLLMHLLITPTRAAAVSFSTPLARRPTSPPPFPLPFPRRALAIADRRPETTSGAMGSSSVAPHIAAAGEMVFLPILEEGVFRFDCSGKDRDAAFPSLSFADPKARETPVAVHRKVPEFVPAFEQLSGQQIVKIKLPSETSLYGTGEVSGQLERTGKRIFTWNTDAWGYGPETTSLYQSHPWVLAVLPNGKALGVLADTTRRCEIDLREASIIKFISTAAYPVLTFGPFESPTDVLISLSHAIGCLLNPIHLILINIMFNWCSFELVFV